MGSFAHCALLHFCAFIVPLWMCTAACTCLFISLVIQAVEVSNCSLKGIDPVVSLQEWVALKTEFDKLKKDNVILSKAVAVQHSRLQELGGKEQELQCMRELLAQYQDRLRTLELTNYSLTMHLQQATGPPFGPRTGGPPDVF